MVVRTINNVCLSQPRRSHVLTSQFGDRDFLVSAECYNEDDDGLKVVSCEDDEKVFLPKNESVSVFPQREVLLQSRK